MPDPEQPCAFQRHDHGRCRADALAAAQAICAAKGLRLTPARARTLEVLLESHKALGAYEVLDRLAADGLGAQPPVAYRALDFLVTNGFAHRIEKLNAFVACVHPGGAHAPAFMICRSCRKVAETASDEAQDGLDAAANALGFAIEAQVLELEGLCPACRADAPA
jgi:Fur family zinc uptake transcriptional regulator